MEHHRISSGRPSNDDELLDSFNAAAPPLLLGGAGGGGGKGAAAGHLAWSGNAKVMLMMRGVLGSV